MLNIAVPFKKNFKEILSFGLGLVVYLVLFLNVYKPFFIGALSPGQRLMLTLFIGLYTTVLMTITFSSAFFLNFHKIRWTLTWEILWNIFHFIFIGSFIYIVAKQYDVLHSLTWYQAIYATFCVGVIPIGMDIFIRVQKANSTGKKTILNSNNTQVLYVKSEGNYLEVYSIDNENKVHRDVIRTSLKSYVNTHTNGIVQIHRSYLVNPNFIASIQGNSNGGSVTLKTQNSIPYSRSFYPVTHQIKEELGSGLH